MRIKVICFSGIFSTFSLEWSKEKLFNCVYFILIPSRTVSWPRMRKQLQLHVMAPPFFYFRVSTKFLIKDVFGVRYGPESRLFLRQSEVIQK